MWCWCKIKYHKNAFQQDAYRPLIDHISSYPMQTPPPQPCMPPQPHMPPTTTHAPWQPRTPPSNHACPPATTQAPPPLWTEWQTGVKILPCPKLRLRAIKIVSLPFRPSCCRIICCCRKIYTATRRWRTVTAKGFTLTIICTLYTSTSVILYRWWNDINVHLQWWYNGWIVVFVSVIKEKRLVNSIFPLVLN